MPTRPSSITAQPYGTRLQRLAATDRIGGVPTVNSVWPPLDPASRAARRALLELAAAAVGGDVHASGDAYPAHLDRIAAQAAQSPEEAKRLLEAAATLLALAVGRMALDDEADFVREFDEVDFVTEMTLFERSVDEVLADPSLGTVPTSESPAGGFPG
jgi:hypothetical protein